MSYDFKIIDNFTLKYLEKCETLLFMQIFIVRMALSRRSRLEVFSWFSKKFPKIHRKASLYEPRFQAFNIMKKGL